MAEIQRRKLDELENLIFELNCITYLQALVEYDKNCVNSIITEFDFSKGTDNYLLKKQIDTVSKLNDLFNTM